MKFQQKSPALIEAEKREAEEYRERILEALKRVPARVLHGGSIQAAVSYKKIAAKAHAIALSKSSNHTKLRDAWAMISPYYSMGQL